MENSISKCQTKHRVSENNAANNYQCPPKPNTEVSRILCSTYSNHAFTVANYLQTYQAHTFHLEGIDYFFSDPKEPDKLETSSLDTSGVFRHVCAFFCLRYRKQRAAVQNRHQLAQHLLIQTYNKKPPRVRTLFSDTVEGAAQRTAVRAMHRKLYSSGLFRRKLHTCYITSGKEFIGVIEKDGGVLLDDEKCRKKQESEDADIRRRKELAFHSSPEFTYTLLPDGVLHISRADTSLRNVASKHALQASCEPEVIYAGTCRLELRDGEEGVVFVIDNDSGTYAPKNDKGELARLKCLLEWNFHGLKVDAKIFVPPEMDDDDDEEEE